MADDHNQKLGERVAVLEADVERIDTEVNSRVRPNLHHTANKTQQALLRIDALEKSQARVIEHTLPDFTRTLDEVSKQLRQISDRVMTRSTDMGWVMRISGFVLQFVGSAAMVYLGWALTHAAVR